MNISPHISYAVGTKSQTAIRKGINNTPNSEQLVSMSLVAHLVFEPVREHFGIPIGISSFFRSVKLNKTIGGSKSSQHCKGEAIDMDADMYGGVTNIELYDWIRENLAYDQLIFEYQWVHVSYRKDRNRMMAFEIKQ